ncbi:putative cytochrome P450 305a1 isoform X2 [Lasioglossum baleicum]|uniref:putative cytochrome P450 305a1 isoform X2 n=1 Tax=Lasioglossum baleicum TaxID=434251 RepID=UPI003FCCD035
MSPCERSLRSNVPDFLTTPRPLTAASRPFPWPIIGNRFLVKRLTIKYGGLHMAIRKLCKEYGENVLTLHMGSEKVLVVSGNKLVLSVLKNEPFDGRPWNEFIKIRNLGKKQGISMNDGQDWKDLRGWMVHTLKDFGYGKSAMSDMIIDEMNEVLDKLKGGGVRRLKPIFAPAVINVLWRLSTGKRFLEGARLQYFIDLMERRANVFDMVGGLLTTFPWIRHIAPDASGYNVLLELNKELKGFLLENISEHRKGYILGSEADLIDKFLLKMLDVKETSNVYTEDQLVMVLVDLFLAGFLTTTITLEFLFLNMIVHQDVQRKLQKEIDSMIPADRLPDIPDKFKLPYTDAVMNESQRMWPVFPVIGPRRVLQDTNLEHFKIPKESTVLIDIYSVNRDPNLFPDPDVFNPERYFKDGVYEPDSKSLTFGRGKRRCPGEVLAKSATFMLFAGVMQKFTLLPPPGQELNSIEIVPGLAISPKPYDVLLVPR